MNEEVVAVFIPIVAIVMSLGIPIIYQILDYRRRRDVVEAHHKERMAAIERGMELSALPEAFYSPLDRNKRPRHLLTGMVWLFIGIAVFLFLGAVADSSVAFLGLIPAGVGAAFLIYYFIEGRNELAEYKANLVARDATTSTAVEQKSF
jgi:Domain of unknown function (DUF6249)